MTIAELGGATTVHVGETIEFSATITIPPDSSYADFTVSAKSVD